MLGRLATNKASLLFDRLAERSEDIWHDVLGVPQISERVVVQLPSRPVIVALALGVLNHVRT